jgi:putative transposase
VRKAFRYRIYPTKAQTTSLETNLRECRWLYNYLLEQRNIAYETEGTSPSLYTQQASIPALKQQRESLRSVHSQVLQNVAVRLDLAMQAFFRRLKAGDSPGYPRFQGRDRYDSLTFPQVGSGCKLEGATLSLSKIGQIKVLLHRPIEGAIKTCTIKRDSIGKWWAIFSCELETPDPLPVSEESVGIDVGLKDFAFLSTDEAVPAPKFYRRDEKDLGKAQRKLSAQTKGSHERRHRKKAVGKVHARIANRRKDFVHQLSRKLVNRFGFLAVEDLHTKRLVHHHCFAKSILDAAWSQFFGRLTYKAEWAGRTLIKVNPAYTSQDCYQCGHRQKMPLSERTYNCPSCGQSCHRDLNASLNILRVALGQQCAA